jgi:hypothetical protein
MALLRYIFGTIWCLFVWLVTAIIIGIVVALIFPWPGDHAFVGIGIGWRNLPGTILGFLAAVQSWRTHVCKPAKTQKETISEESGNT